MIIILLLTLEKKNYGKKNLATTNTKGGDCVKLTS